jgi:hypothetical protein
VGGGRGGGGISAYLLFLDTVSNTLIFCTHDCTHTPVHFRLQYACGMEDEAGGGRGSGVTHPPLSVSSIVWRVYGFFPM